MAITMKDIQEKVFSTQAANGYSVEEVDDFLDAIVEELRTLTRENLQLQHQNAELTKELASKEQALAETSAQVPDYNEAGYFKNLQSTMRDTLISAQRVADDTIANAKAEAERLTAQAQNEAECLLSKAHTEAETATARAQGAVAAAKEECESLKKAAEEYRAAFRQLVEKQLTVLKDPDLLFN